MTYSLPPWQRVPHSLACALVLNTGPNTKREFSMSCPEIETRGNYNSWVKVKVSLSCYRGATNASFQFLHHKVLIPTLHGAAEGELKWL